MSKKTKKLYVYVSKNPWYFDAYLCSQAYVYPQPRLVELGMVEVEIAVEFEVDECV